VNLGSPKKTGLSGWRGLIDSIQGDVNYILEACVSAVGEADLAVNN
jgi:hypothetical protein